MLLLGIWVGMNMIAHGQPIKLQDGMICPIVNYLVSNNYMRSNDTIVVFVQNIEFNSTLHKCVTVNDAEFDIIVKGVCRNWENDGALMIREIEHGIRDNDFFGEIDNFNRYYIKFTTFYAGSWNIGKIEIVSKPDSTKVIDSWVTRAIE
jgi:hypothetical protein